MKHKFLYCVQVKRMFLEIMSVPFGQAIRDNYERLPAGERKIADILLEMRGESAAYSATELAGRAGVSKATATRLVRRLGFDDFQQMRQRIREETKTGSPLAAFSDAREHKGSLGAHLGHEIACLTRTVEAIEPGRARYAVDILATAGRLWVVGFRNSYALALYARELLVQVKPDVRLLPLPGQTVAEEISAVTAGDAVLAVAFRRRPPVLARMLRAAVDAQARVVLLGDPSLGDLDRLASVTFRCSSRGSSLFDSYVAPLSLLNYLCSEVAVALGEAAQARLRLTEQLHEEFGDFGR